MELPWVAGLVFQSQECSGLQQIKLYGTDRLSFFLYIPQVLIIHSLVMSG